MSYELEFLVGVGEWNFYYSFLELKLQTRTYNSNAHSSQIVQSLSTVALFVQVSEGDAFVSEVTAKAGGLYQPTLAILPVLIDS